MTAIVHRSLAATGIAVIVAAMAYGGVSAAEKKKAEPKPPTCNSTALKHDEAGCTAREDCTWVAGSVNSKTKKEIAAYCRSKPKAKAKAPPKEEKKAA